MPMNKTSFKQRIMQEVKEEVVDIQRERDEAEQARLEAESEWAKAYEEDFRRERQREEEEFFERERQESNNYYDEPEPPF